MKRGKMGTLNKAKGGRNEKGLNGYITHLFKKKNRISYI